MNKLFSVLLITAVMASCENSTKQAQDKTDDPPDAEINKLTHLASPADSVSAEPYLFTDKNGLVYLSWIEKGKEKNWLKFSVLNNNQWGEPVVIGSGDNWFVNWADYPQLATDGAENLVAHFLEKSAKGTYTYDIKLVTSADHGKT